MEDWRYPSFKEAASNGFMNTRIGKSWNRWFALRRHLDAYEWVLTVDPDQFPSQECFLGRSLSTVLKDAGADDPSVMLVMRDFPRFHTLNSAGVFLRQGSGARLFLDLLFARMYWEGVADFDQSAFDQSILEFLDLWSAEQFANRKAIPGSRCLIFQLAWLDGSNILERYLQCWHDRVDSLFGPFGEREYVDGAPLRLLDPRLVDINYVIGSRPQDDAPLIWHLAGKDKFYKDDETGVTVLDHYMQVLWKTASLPPRSTDGDSFLLVVAPSRGDGALNQSSGDTAPTSAASARAAGLVAAGVGRGPGAGVEGRSVCELWAAAAEGAVCEPGTKVVDCRSGWLAIC